MIAKPFLPFTSWPLACRHAGAPACNPAKLGSAQNVPASQLHHPSTSSNSPGINFINFPSVEFLRAWEANGRGSTGGRAEN